MAELEIASSGFYIADNDMLGREDLDYIFTWFAIEPWSVIVGFSYFIIRHPSFE